jgi:hypothetical protein
MWLVVLHVSLNSAIPVCLVVTRCCCALCRLKQLKQNRNKRIPLIVNPPRAYYGGPRAKQKWTWRIRTRKCFIHTGHSDHTVNSNASGVVVHRQQKPFQNCFVKHRSRRASL